MGVASCAAAVEVGVLEGLEAAWAVQACRDGCMGQGCAGRIGAQQDFVVTPSHARAQVQQLVGTECQAVSIPAVRRGLNRT